MVGCVKDMVGPICVWILLWGLGLLGIWVLDGGILEPYSIVWYVKTQPVCLISGGGFLLWLGWIRVVHGKEDKEAC